MAWTEKDLRELIVSEKRFIKIRKDDLENNATNLCHPCRSYCEGCEAHTREILQLCQQSLASFKRQLIKILETKIQKYQSQIYGIAHKKPCYRKANDSTRLSHLYGKIGQVTAEINKLKIEGENQWNRHHQTPPSA